MYCDKEDETASPQIFNEDILTILKNADSDTVSKVIDENCDVNWMNCSKIYHEEEKIIMFKRKFCI